MMISCIPREIPQRTGLPAGNERFFFTIDPDYPSYLLQEDGGVIGFCFLTRFEKTAGIQPHCRGPVCLRPGSTGRGISTAALKILKEAAKTSGIRVITGTLCRKNPAGIRLRETGG